MPHVGRFAGMVRLHMRPFSVACALLLAVSARADVTLRSPAPGGAADVEPEEYAVYNAVLEKRFGSKWDKKIAVTAEPINVEARSERFKAEDLGLAALQQSTYDSYRKRRKGTLAANRFARPVVLFNPPDKPVGAEWYQLSRVGFNEARTQALVLGDYHCPLCGDGHSYLLEKRKGVWSVVAIVMRWIS